MIHTQTTLTSSKLATVTNALFNSLTERGEDGVFHQLIDFPWLPGNS